MEILCDVRTELGEAPYWDKKSGSLFWVDIFGKCFYRYFLKKKSCSVWLLPEMVSAVFPLDEESCILTLEHRIVRFYYKTEKIVFLALAENHDPGNRLNDAKCDNQGRLWFGSMDRNSTRISGAFYRMDQDGSVRKVFSHVSVSNGIGWSPDYNTMYYTDTQTFRLDAFDFDRQSGELSNRRIVLRVASSMGLTDGMAVDCEGMIWLALWDGARIIRIDPEKGEVLKELPVPALRVTSLCFGGEGMDELFITSARTGLNQSKIAKYPDSGALFRQPVGIRGMDVSSISLSD